MHMFNDGSYFMGGLHGLGWIFWLVVIAALLYLGRGRLGAQGRQPRETAHEVLRRRLASGDITPEEYEKRKLLLDRDAGGIA